MITRVEHLNWCKERALEYANRGDAKNAVASMGSDLNKHPETQNHPGTTLGVGLLMLGEFNDRGKLIRWIEGFN